MSSEPIMPDDADTSQMNDGAPDALAMALDSLSGSGRSAMERIVANALNNAEDADAALERAQRLRQNAESYRAEVETEIIRATEQLCDSIREKATTAKGEAAEMLQAAEKAKVTADHIKRESDTIRHNAEHRASEILIHAQKEATEILAGERRAAQEEIERGQAMASASIEKALTDIEKLKKAAQVEKEAQTLYQHVVQIRRAGPSLKEVDLAPYRPAPQRVQSSE